MSPPAGRFAWARRATAAAFLGLLALGDRLAAAPMRGSTTASELLGTVRLTDPLAALEVGLAARALAADIALGALLLLAAAALLGPVFCGWVCPLGLLFDLAAGLRRRARAAAALPDLRLAALGLVLALTATTRVPAFQVVSPINALGWAAAFAAGPALFGVAGLLLLDLVLPRTWCRSLCPLGAVYALAGRFAPLRVRGARGPGRCTPCGRCTASCPMGIAVLEDHVAPGRAAVDAAACTRCGACIDACPRGALRLGFRAAGAPPAQCGGRSPRSGQPGVSPS